MRNFTNTIAAYGQIIDRQVDVDTDVAVSGAGMVNERASLPARLRLYALPLGCPADSGTTPSSTRCQPTTPQGAQWQSSGGESTGAEASERSVGLSADRRAERHHGLKPSVFKPAIPSVFPSLAS